MTLIVHAGWSTWILNVWCAEDLNNDFKTTGCEGN